MYKLLRFTAVILLMVGVLFTSVLPAKANTYSALGDIFWSRLTETESSNLNDITYANGVYVTVGDNGTILYSRDAATWRSSNFMGTGDVLSVATDGKRFVAAGTNGIILFSDNGLDWTAGELDSSSVVADFFTTTEIRNYNFNRNDPVERSEIRVSSVIWDGQRYVGAGIVDKAVYDGDNSFRAHTFKFAICTSSNGQTWSLQPPGNMYQQMNDLDMGTSRPDTINKLIYTGSLYVGIGGPAVFTSSDLADWQVSIPDNYIQLKDLIYADGKIMTIGWDGASTYKRAARNINVLCVSEDGENWTTQDLLSHEYAPSISWVNGELLAASRFSVMMRGTPGEEFSRIYNSVSKDHSQTYRSDPYIYKILYDGKQYVAVGQNGSILTIKKLDQKEYASNEWNVARERAFGVINNLLYADGRYLASSYFNNNSQGFLSAGGQSGLLWESTDGFHWEPVKFEGLTPYFAWNTLASGNGVILAFGDGSDSRGNWIEKVYRSTEPDVWEEIELPVKLSGDYLSFANDRFYLSGKEGFISSQDGRYWTTLQTPSVIMKKIVGNGTAALGSSLGTPPDYESNVLFYSSDGTDWTKPDMKLNRNDYANRVNDIHWNGQQFTVTGGEGAAAVSTDGVNWTVKRDNAYIDDLSWNGEQFWATGVSKKERLYSSADGLTYTAVSVPNTAILETRMIWDGEKFLIGGRNGTILVGKATGIIHLQIDGKPVKLENLPVVVDGSTMLPVVEIFSVLGASASWDGETSTAIGFKNNHEVRLTMDAAAAVIDNKTVEISTPTQIVNDRLMAPARFIAEAFGYKVKWDDATRTINIIME